MFEDVLNATLQQVKALHESQEALNAFCPFPDDVAPQAVAPFHVPPADLMQADTGLGASEYPELRDALVDVSPAMQWRETYKETDIGADFMDRFGCYEIIGRDAPFSSEKMRSFLVYQPPHLHYPWHHHPAEEIYVVIAGQAEFHTKNKGSKTLVSGQSSFHPSNVPHALSSHEHPVMAYVVWRADFDVAPVWST